MAHDMHYLTRKEGVNMYRLPEPKQAEAGNEWFLYGAVLYLVLQAWGWL